jgi:hypothetical protein
MNGRGCDAGEAGGVESWDSQVNQRQEPRRWDVIARLVAVAEILVAKIQSDCGAQAPGRDWRAYRIPAALS